jgi:hypothetical protein
MVFPLNLLYWSQYTASSCLTGFSTRVQPEDTLPSRSLLVNNNDGMHNTPMAPPNPGFPVKFVGVDKPYAAFLNESRTRGCWLVPRTGNPGANKEKPSGAAGEFNPITPAR